MTIARSKEPKEFAAFEHDGWENAAEGYERLIAPITRQSVPATLDAAKVAKGMRVLDVCTGPGILAQAAVKRGAEAVGLDFSSNLIEIARRAVPQAEFRQGDAQELPFEDDSFDAVVCGYGIIHLPDPEKGLREIHRVLKPGGTAAVSTWEMAKPSNGFGMIFGALNAHGNLDVPIPDGPSFLQFSEPEDMTAALQATGFRDTAVRMVDQTFETDEPLGFIQALLDGAVRARALIVAQDDATRTAINETVADAMKQFRTTEGGYRVPMPAVVGSGVK